MLIGSLILYHIAASSSSSSYSLSLPPSILKSPDPPPLSTPPHPLPTLNSSEPPTPSSPPLSWTPPPPVPPPSPPPSSLSPPGSVSPPPPPSLRPPGKHMRHPPHRSPLLAWPGVDTAKTNRRSRGMNSWKMVGLLFRSIVVFLQIIVAPFLLYKRNQLFRLFKHAYYLDFQIMYQLFLEKLVSWDVVSARLEMAMALVEEREREEENKKRQEEEDELTSKDTVEMYLERNTDDSEASEAE